MGYKQPKNTPMHGAPMYSNRDGSSIFGANQYDELQGGARMKDTYMTKDGASEPITLAIIGKKIALGAKKLFASKIGGSLVGAGVGALSKDRREVGDSGEIGQKKNTAFDYTQSNRKLKNRYSKTAAESLDEGDASKVPTPDVNGSSMGPSKVDFADLFSKVGDFVKKVKDSDAVKNTASYIANKDGEKSIGHTIVDNVKQRAISKGIDIVGNLVKPKPQGQTNSPEPQSKPHEYKAQGYDRGGGYSMGASVPAASASVPDSVKTAQYNFKMDNEENNSKRQGIGATIKDSFLKNQRNLNISGVNVDARGAAIPIMMRNSRSEMPTQPDSVYTTKPTITSHMADSTANKFKKLGSFNLDQ